MEPTQGIWLLFLFDFFFVCAEMAEEPSATPHPSITAALRDVHYHRDPGYVGDINRVHHLLSLPAPVNRCMLKGCPNAGSFDKPELVCQNCHKVAACTKWHYDYTKEYHDHVECHRFVFATRCFYCRFINFLCLALNFHTVMMRSISIWMFCRWISIPWLPFARGQSNLMQKTNSTSSMVCVQCFGTKQTFCGAGVFERANHEQPGSVNFVIVPKDQSSPPFIEISKERLHLYSIQVLL
jgi:hypothetical protein